MCLFAKQRLGLHLRGFKSFIFRHFWVGFSIADCKPVGSITLEWWPNSSILCQPTITTQGKKSNKGEWDAQKGVPNESKNLTCPELTTQWNMR